MDFNVKSGQVEKLKTQSLVLPVFDSGKLAEQTKTIDKLAGGAISKVVKMGDIEGKLGQTLLLHNLPNTLCDRVLLIGCGKQADFDGEAYLEAVVASILALNGTGTHDSINTLPLLNVSKQDTTWKIQHAVVRATHCVYKYEDYKSNPAKKPSKNTLSKITWLVANARETTKANQACEIGMAISAGMKLTRDLGNCPPNVCTPSYLAKTAQKLAKDNKKLSCAILEKKDLQALKMGCFLSVTQGSPTPPKLITLQYSGGKKNQAPIVLVGKGITFDTGGNSLKPSASMVGMKYDMCGAATVLGMMQFVADAGLALNVIGLVAAAENMPGGDASRPDDIVTSMAGLTVEILNTDAEGRLVLCDTLTYCERYKPEVVIDMATLTGACVVALGRHKTAVYSNNDKLAKELLAAGMTSYDTGWHMPLGKEYTKQLESPHADLANIGGSEAGSVTAACFLAKFTEKYTWAHLDIAGTACSFTGPKRGSTGRPIPMLAEYLLGKC